MSVYAVGDVQGCYAPLCNLLDRVGFEPARDQLWFVGDLVNRGPDSLEVLRRVRSFGSAARVVLGNHDLHLLQVADGVRSFKAGDTLQTVLDAPDADELLGWLREQPLLHCDAALGFCMVHAGIPPHWDLEEARLRAREASEWVQRRGWCDEARGSRARSASASQDAQRTREALDYFTRMRFCDAEGRLELKSNGGADKAPRGYLPWFAHPARKTRGVRIVFGHWAALQGEANAPNVYALDTGCVWGRELTLMRLEDGQRMSCACGSNVRGGELGVD
jgi:bis(5'-nucleosyl)-tetraphosphatase (symmetrical)